MSTAKSSHFFFHPTTFCRPYPRLPSSPVLPTSYFFGDDGIRICSRAYVWYAIKARINVHDQSSTSCRASSCRWSHHRIHHDKEGHRRNQTSLRKHRHPCRDKYIILLILHQYFTNIPCLQMSHSETSTQSSVPARCVG